MSSLSKRPVGRYRTLARVIRLDETDEPETEPTCGCRFDAENDAVQVAQLGVGGVGLSGLDATYGPGSMESSESPHCNLETARSMESPGEV
jgi:hypothetical protein